MANSTSRASWASLRTSNVSTSFQSRSRSPRCSGAWQIERRKRTRHLIELGGLVVKAGVVNLTNDDRAMIWIAEKLKSEGGEHARDTWTKLGKMAFEMERPADTNDRVPPQPDRA